MAKKRTQFYVGDEFLMMSFDSFDWIIAMFQNKKYRNFSRDTFNAMPCIVEEIETVNITGKHGDALPFVTYYIFIKKCDRGFGGFTFRIHTNDGKFFWSENESEKPEYKIIFVGKDIDGLKKNISDFSKAIIEKTLVKNVAK